ncbi:MAG TPA: hypothetical protein VJR05_06640 [Acidimicrobiia bacterium]|nr:hypothetical protein [Acidimicrobiia bacterium]
MRRGIVFLIGLALVASATSAVVALSIVPSQPRLELHTVTGLLERCGNGFCIGEGRFFFGPEWYLRQTRSDFDLAGDGEQGSLYEELAGSIGRQVTVEAADDEVYVVDGLPWRSFADPPPWQQDPSPRSPEPPATSPASPVMVREGQLNACGSGYCLEGTLLYLGPWWYLVGGVASHDFDGDGALETPQAELDGLVGATVEIEVKVDEGVNRVISIEGHEWQPANGPPPWTGGPTAVQDAPDDDSSPTDGETPETEPEETEPSEGEVAEEDEGPPPDLTPPLPPPAPRP